MALTWSGVDVSPRDLTAEVFTPSRNGSLQSAMIAATRRHARIAYLLPNPHALVEEVAAGHPVIVLQNLGLSWYPVWHYAVVIGWDLTHDNLILHSGTTPHRQLGLSVFERTWARSQFWGLLVLPPSQLPAVAEAKAYLQALTHLERLGRWDVAAEGYQTALGRWPDSLPAVVGLGVCLYRIGNLAAAEVHFRDAIAKFPHEGVLYNNLAHVLMEMGRSDEATQSALKAVEIGGPRKADFESTLEAIKYR
jgi:tetratricopeptide (TPR) repeat protein